MIEYEKAKAQFSKYASSPFRKFQQEAIQYAVESDRKPKACSGGITIPAGAMKMQPVKIARALLNGDVILRNPAVSMRPGKKRYRHRIFPILTMLRRLYEMQIMWCANRIFKDGKG